MLFMPLLDDHGVGRISGGEIVRIHEAIDLGPLNLPGREQAARQDVADVVVQHVEVVEDIRHLRIAGSE